MPTTSTSRDADFILVEQCLQHDAVALQQLRSSHEGLLAHLLGRRGATRQETRDLLADLWSDCLNHQRDSCSLLARYSGGCSLKNWLATVATNRFLDLRKRADHRLRATPDPEMSEEEFLAVAGPKTPPLLACEHVTTLLRTAFMVAWGQPPPEVRIMLYLVFIEGVNQREIAHMFSLSEAKVCRLMSRAMTDIQKATLREVRAREPWLKVTWRDLRDLAESLEYTPDNFS